MIRTQLLTCSFFLLKLFSYYLTNLKKISFTDTNKPVCEKNNILGLNGQQLRFYIAVKMLHKNYQNLIINM